MAIAVIAGVWSSGAANATPPIVVVPQSDDSFSASRSEGAFGFMSQLSRSSYLLGDMWGLRPFMSRYGLSFALQETSEILGNVSGGNHRGFDYDGLTTMVLQMDTMRAFGWRGGTFNVSALQVHGRNLSADNLGTLQTSSGIEADRATRLWEIWYQQQLLSEDRLDVRIGQQSLDQEFIGSQNALLFVNTMFGWPMVPSVDLPGGGPAYPLSALGIRFKGRPSDSLTILAGVFNGAPAGNTSVDAQLDNPSGLSFPVNGGALAIGEIQYSYPSFGAMVSPDDAGALSGTYKLGFWYDTEQFADYRYDSTGRALADPASNGIARNHRGDLSLYGVVDQMVWRSAEDPDRTLSVFLRVMGTPQSDRNLVDFSLNAGLNFHEPIAHRDDDTFGIGMGYAKLGGSASAFDADIAKFSGSYYPVRKGETFIEVTYQYEFTPWLQIQPDFQYIFNPGGGELNADGTSKVGDEAVLGIRTNILF